MKLISYLDQLEVLADSQHIRLKQAFLQAGVPDSTYYRVMNGQDLRFDTALKVANAIRSANDATTTDQGCSHTTGQFGRAEVLR
jgi:predicted transcriptional regulator